MAAKLAGENDEDADVYLSVLKEGSCSSPRGQIPLKIGDIREEVSMTRPWADLPRDITANILQRLGAVELLETAEKVCTKWYSVCKDPSMWRDIYIPYDGYPFDMRFYLQRLCRRAVNRSQGQLVHINLERFATDELLDYIAERSGNLKQLRLFCCDDISAKCLTEAIKRFPKLESLNVCIYTFSKETIEIVGRSCPLLSLFALNRHVYGSCNMNDDEAFAIARSMPELRFLQLLRNGLTNVGLEAIIKGCPHLESLDLRQCNYVKPEGDFEKRLSEQIKSLQYSEYHSPDEDDEDDMISCRDLDFGGDSD